MLWRHIEWRDGSGEVRRSRRLVISSFSAIGNYDYGFFWYLYQDGTIEFEVKLTGVLSTGAVAPGERPAHGTLVAPGLNAMVHQHFFNMRLDLDIDGLANGVDEVWTESLPPGPGNPYGNAFARAGGASRRELEARRRVDAASARWWEIVNPSILHRLGEPIGYRLLPGETTFAFAQPDAPVSKRAAFIREHLWVTPYRADERYAAGEYPNLHPGGDGPARVDERRPRRSTTRTSSSGTRSATTTSRGPRTGRSCRSRRRASCSSRSASSSAIRRSTCRPRTPHSDHCRPREQHVSTVEGRVALVTGASSGIGAATAKTLAAQRREGRARVAPRQRRGHRGRARAALRRARSQAARAASWPRRSSASAASTSWSRTPASAPTATSSTSPPSTSRR